MRRRWRRKLAGTLSTLRRGVAALVALATVMTVLFAGHTYFFCAPMSRVAFEDCCGEREHDEEAHGRASMPAVDETHRCCEERVFARAEPGSGTVPYAHVPSSPVGEVLPAAAITVPSRRAFAGLARLPDSRAGPDGIPPSSPLASRVPVDVSLT